MARVSPSLKLLLTSVNAMVSSAIARAVRRVDRPRGPTQHGAKSGSGVILHLMATPPSASIHEEATVSAAVPFMSLYNNLVMFDQHAPKNSLETVVPDLATKWDWKPDT